jgi:subtilisin-like proprotein convertase family protein
VALHKSQHNWIEFEEIRSSKRLTLEPFTATTGKAFKLVNSSFTPGQYLILENRSRFGFDTHLPGEGLLVWRVDEFKEMFAPLRPALQLVQADGRHELETVGDNNAGDRGDPFPGATGRTELNDTGDISTSFPGGDNSGIVLKQIQRDPATGIITLDAEFDGLPVADQPPDDEGDTTGNLQIVSGEKSPELAIPDNDRNGVNSSIAIAEKGAAREIAVSVDILHTYIGDLRVELIAPSGQRAVLHNQTGGTAENLKQVYRSSSNPLLAALVDTPIDGQWVLHVADLQGADTGELKKWGLALAVDQEKRSVHEVRTPELQIPDNDPSGIAGTIAVSRGGMVRHIAVEVDIAHTFRRDLRVELLNPQRDSAILHNRTGGDADDLKETYLSRETPGMAGFIGKPARGDWVLRVSDLEGQDRGSLNRWVLDIELEPGIKVVEHDVSPNLQIPDDDATGVGSAVAVSEAGTAQSIEIDLTITHTYIGDLRVELVAPSGERAILHDRVGGSQHNLALQLDSAGSQEIAGLIGQPIKGNWILRVMDLAGRDVGRLDTWSLRLFYV